MKNILFLLLLTAFQFSFCQETKPIILGETRTLKSEVLSENRTLNIYLPAGYNENIKEQFPVIYLLDGSENEDFIHVCGLIQFMNMYDLAPKSIIVGIANVDRKRDYTFPTTVKQDKIDFPTTGSSEKFISFLENELQPFIAKNYRTSDSKTIIGQSLGGLLATEILLKKPNLFSTYIITSPSLWWDNESLLVKAPENLKLVTNKKIYVAVGKEGKVMERDAKNLFSLLQKNTSGCTLKFHYFGNEDHATILHNSIYKAFELLYPKK